MTLDELIIETANNVGEEISKTEGVYAGDSLIIVNKIITGLNDAKNRMAERIGYYETETVTLVSAEFDKADLTNTIKNIVTIESDDYPVIYVENGDGTVKIMGGDDEDVDVTYSYLLPDMVIGTLTGVCPVDNALDLTYYAAYKYFLQDGGESATRKAANWLALWKESLNKIRKSAAQPQQIVDVYGW